MMMLIVILIIIILIIYTLMWMVILHITYDRCDGTWGIAVINREEPDQIVVACNGSPMVIGLGQVSDTLE